VELFYASDVFGGLPTRADMTSLSSAFDGGQHLTGDIFDDSPTRHDQRPFNASNVEFGNEMFGSFQPNSMLTKLFRPESDEQTELLSQHKGTTSPDAEYKGEVRSDAVHNDFEDQQARRRLTWGPTVTFSSTLLNSEDLPESSVPDTSLAPPKPQALTRLDILAQPRVDLFVEREKRRLQQEVESLRECTFKPNLTKQRIDSAPAISSTEDLRDYLEKRKPRRSDPGGFPWLSLSPRQKSQSHDPRRRMTWDGQTRERNQNVIQRLHLDGTTRYDLREQAKEALEVERLRSCTFKPAINPTSRSLAFGVNYKPIHERVTEIQRAKVSLSICIARRIVQNL
jgi:hypothetical protein